VSLPGESRLANPVANRYLIRWSCEHSIISLKSRSFSYKPVPRLIIKHYDYAMARDGSWAIDADAKVA
jgi:hypothetical protein